jgi:hypothetical protein
MLDFMLFHTFPAVRIWHRLTAGCSQLSRNILKEFIVHVIEEVQAAVQKWF